MSLVLLSLVVVSLVLVDLLVLDLVLGLLVLTINRGTADTLTCGDFACVTSMHAPAHAGGHK